MTRMVAVALLEISIQVSTGIRTACTQDMLPFRTSCSRIQLRGFDDTYAGDMVLSRLGQMASWTFISASMQDYNGLPFARGHLRDGKVPTRTEVNRDMIAQCSYISLNVVERSLERPVVIRATRNPSNGRNARSARFLRYGFGTVRQRLGSDGRCFSGDGTCELKA